MSHHLFRTLMRRADRKRIWAYEGMTLWAIPYILLLLGDYEFTAANLQQIEFHFVLRRLGVRDVPPWRPDALFEIRKLFSDTRNLVKGGDNPLIVSREAYEARSVVTFPVTTNLLRVSKA